MFQTGHWKWKIKQILMLYQANAPTLTRCNFLKHIPKFITFGTHNLQTFKHNTLIKELLVIQFYLFNIRSTLHHQKWWTLCITLPVNRKHMAALFLVCSLRDNNVINKHNYMKTEAYKLCSTVSWIILAANVIKSIVITLNYTISKLVHFFWDAV